MGLPGVTPVVDLQLTCFLLAAISAGTALGTATGLVPGLHANNVALVLASVAAGLPGPPLAIAAAMLAAGVAHTFLNAIPALAIGVPDAEMAVSALPGHRLVRNGRGREAIRLSVLGSALAVVVAVPLAIPITGLMLRGYPLIVANLRVILAVVVVGMLAMEHTRRSRAAGALTFFGAAALGWGFLDADPAAPLAAGGVLAPLFAGLFGAPILLEAMRGGGVPPQGDAAICTRPSAVGATALAGTIAGAVVGYLPGISAAIAAVAVLVAMPGDISDRGYLIATSGVDTANSIFALFALWAIGSPRTGVLVGVDRLGAPLNIPILIASVLLAGGLSAAVTLTVGDRYLSVVGSIDHRIVAGAVLALLVGISFLFAGALGIGLFVAATCVGMIPVRFGAFRVHCMGVLIGPMLLAT
ncbi:tripartite tricarboxylate transporter permease [Salinarchaeum laminariae]|uniref:tripartite tricarboxylate transporter permease n=1 Tax=Salinarchaeum laminariae TaxID=869888 RepID=UPI0035C1335E